MSLRVITYNVGGRGDTQRLMELAGRPAAEFNNDAAADQWYTERVFQTIVNGKFFGVDADILCLQEFYGYNLEKQPLVSAIKAAGFTLLGKGDLAIAYKADKFTPLKEGSTANGRGAFYAYLQDNNTHKIIRVVTDHIQGFNGRSQKLFTQALKDQFNPSGFWNVLVDKIGMIYPSLRKGINPMTQQPWKNNEKASALETKKMAPHEGDEALARSLKFLEQQKEITYDATVYCLDANTTADYIPRGDGAARLHPHRIRLLTNEGFICDTTDLAPTIVDHNLVQGYLCKKRVPVYEEVNSQYHKKPDVQMKYDYILSKAGPGHQISIKSKALGPLPDQFATILSDHRAVYAEIDLREGMPQEEVLPMPKPSLFSAVFRSFMTAMANFLSFFFRSTPTKPNEAVPPTVATEPSVPSYPVTLEMFDDYFRNDPNYAFLKNHTKNLELLLIAGITPADLTKYFELGKTLEGLLDAKNSSTHYQETPEQICEYFVIWCTLKKLQGESMKLKFQIFEGMTLHLIRKLKEGIQDLLKKQPTPIEKNCVNYINQNMQGAELLKPIHL